MPNITLVVIYYTTDPPAIHPLPVVVSLQVQILHVDLSREMKSV